ncbi:uncharacterized protein V6R79_015038 [Siganus canaliculatus]
MGLGSVFLLWKRRNPRGQTPLVFAAVVGILIHHSSERGYYRRSAEIWIRSGISETLLLLWDQIWIRSGISETLLLLWDQIWIRSGISSSARQLTARHNKRTTACRSCSAAFSSLSYGALTVAVDMRAVKNEPFVLQRSEGEASRLQLPAPQKSQNNLYSHVTFS